MTDSSLVILEEYLSFWFPLCSDAGFGLTVASNNVCHKPLVIVLQLVGWIETQQLYHTSPLH
jgi:hypothetical protein